MLIKIDFKGEIFVVNWWENYEINQKILKVEELFKKLIFCNKLIKILQFWLKSSKKSYKNPSCKYFMTQFHKNPHQIYFLISLINSTMTLQPS